MGLIENMSRNRCSNALSVVEFWHQVESSKMDLRALPLNKKKEAKTFVQQC